MAQITWSQAEQLIHNYNQSNYQLKTNVNQVSTTLNGLNFTRSQIQQILDQHTDIDRLFFAYGQIEPNDPNGGQPGATLIVFGAKSTGGQMQLLFQAPAKIYSYGDPCPSICPTNVNLSQL